MSESCFQSRRWLYWTEFLEFQGHFSWWERQDMNARSFLLVCGCGGLLLWAAGGERGPLQAAAGEAASVPVSRPVAREVTDYVDFTGRAEAVNSVNVVARVSGYLVKSPFKEGSDVKAGDLLFEIDPRPYQAQYDQALAQVNLNTAQLKLAQATLAPRRASGTEHARRGRCAAIRPGPCRGRAGRGPDQRRQGRPGDLQAQPGLLHGPLAHRRPRGPLSPHARQPRHPGPDVADHRRFARSRPRLFRRRRTDRAAGASGPRRGTDQTLRAGGCPAGKGDRRQGRADCQSG